MKLYRGIKAEEFSHLTSEVARSLNATWINLLSRRARGDFDYPVTLNKQIIAASKLIRLQRQHFTDRKEIALGYASFTGGVLVEIDVPTKDLVQNFTLEFQNFSRRKRFFEVVYAVDSTKLLAQARKWKMKSSRPRRARQTRGIP